MPIRSGVRWGLGVSCRLNIENPELPQMSVWLDGPVGHLRKAVHSLSENKQDHKLLGFFFVCVWMFFLEGKKENGISLTQRSEAQPFPPQPTHTPIPSAPRVAAGDRRSHDCIPAHPHPLILLFQGGCPSCLWLPEPPPPRIILSMCPICSKPHTRSLSCSGQR